MEKSEISILYSERVASNGKQVIDHRGISMHQSLLNVLTYAEGLNYRIGESVNTKPPSLLCVSAGDTPYLSHLVIR